MAACRACYRRPTGRASSPAVPAARSKPGMYGKARLEQSCARALSVAACSYRSIKSMLQTGMDRQPLMSLPQSLPVIRHLNVRGADYYLSNAGQDQQPSKEEAV